MVVSACLSSWSSPGACKLIEAKKNGEVLSIHRCHVFSHCVSKLSIGRLLLDSCLRFQCLPFSHVGCFHSHAWAQDIESLAQKVMIAVDQHNAANLDLWLTKLRSISEGESAVHDLVRAFDVDENTLLHRCAIGCSEGGECGGQKVVQVLVAARAEANNKNLLGETPLLAAARCPTDVTAADGFDGRFGVVSALLEAAADPSHPDAIASETALMELACRGEAELCRLLLQHRADALLRNSHGRTARDLAIENRQSGLAVPSSVHFLTH